MNIQPFDIQRLLVGSEDGGRQGCGVLDKVSAAVVDQQVRIPVGVTLAEDKIREGVEININELGSGVLVEIQVFLSGR